ncbi:MAG: acyl-CoA thioesterase [Acidimicrobiia bacterium]
MSRFAEDTAVERVGGGQYRAHITDRWSIGSGPNGGYLSAILVRAMQASVADADHALRVFNVHFLAPPTWGDADVLVSVERAGRTLTSVTARIVQSGRPLVVAMAAFGASRTSPEFATHDALPYALPSAGAPAPLAEVPDGVPAIAQRYGYEIVDDPRITGEPVLGGWLRLEDGAPFDTAGVVAAADAWLPVAGLHLPDPVLVPTVELTVYVRRALPPEGIGEHIATRLRSSLVAEGYVEEDGELWDARGELVAISRQLSVVRPVR